MGDKDRTGIAAVSHPAGTPGATGVERLRPRENGQRLGDGGIDLCAGIAWFGDILNIEGSLVEIGPRLIFGNSAVGVRQ